MIVCSDSGVGRMDVWYAAVLGGTAGGKDGEGQG